MTKSATTDLNYEIVHSYQHHENYNIVAVDGGRNIVGTVEHTKNDKLVFKNKDGQQFATAYYKTSGGGADVVPIASEEWSISNNNGHRYYFTLPPLTSHT